jgi:predicted dehydrogenase
MINNEKITQIPQDPLLGDSGGDVHWGIIGCGDVCERKSGPAFYKIEHSSLVAVMRRDEALAKDYAKRHGVPRHYNNAEDLINDPEVNAIYIATPPNTHKTYAIQAMRAGKPVYVEKPMAMNFAECTEMQKVSEETGQPLFVAYYRRALPYFKKVKQLLDENTIGKPVTVSVRFHRTATENDKNPEKHSWRVKKEIAGGGYFYDLAPHTIDILDFLLGEINEVYGLSGNLGGFYDVEDTTSALFRFKTDVQGTGQWSFVTTKQEECDIIEIIGTEGSLHFNTFAFEQIELNFDGKTEYFQTEHPEHIQQPLIQTIVDELRGKGTSPSNGQNGMRTAWVMDKIFTKSLF